MPTLNHVCMWNGKGWQRVTAKEIENRRLLNASPEFLPANTQLFMCELCGQTVDFHKQTDSKSAYFSHKSTEKNKDCPERTFSSYRTPFEQGKYSLPLRIETSHKWVEIQIGFIKVPSSVVSSNFKVKIDPGHKSGSKFTYNSTRFNTGHITYLSVGSQPCARYALNYSGQTQKLSEYWPNEVEGIDPKGTLFDGNSGRKLPYDADVQIGKTYYLLINKAYEFDWTLKNKFRRSKETNPLQIHLWKEKRFGLEEWGLYKICAREFSEEAAKLFLKFHTRLTEIPISFDLLWPLCATGSNCIKMNPDQIYILTKGNIEGICAIPNHVTEMMLTPSKENLQLFRVDCQTKRQFIAFGRIHTLDFTNIWTQKFAQTAQKGRVSVTDLKGQEIPAGKTKTFPEQKRIRVLTNFDGELVVTRCEAVVDRRKLSAGRQIEYSDISRGMRIQVYIGLDLVWEREWLDTPQPQTKKRSVLGYENEQEVLDFVRNTAGTFIPAPHALKNILLGLNECSLLCKWIRTCIQQGQIREQSYRRLQQLYSTVQGEEK